MSKEIAEKAAKEIANAVTAGLDRANKLAAEFKGEEIRHNIDHAKFVPAAASIILAAIEEAQASRKIPLNDLWRLAHTLEVHYPDHVSSIPLRDATKLVFNCVPLPPPPKEQT